MPEVVPPLSASVRTVQITLKYEGKDVDDGTMPIEDVVAALQGFSSAYAKLANRYDPNEQHQIRVSAINKSSFAVLVLAWATENHSALIKGSAAAVQWIVGTVIKVVELKKAAKGQPPVSVVVNGSNNTVIVTTVGNVQTEVPPEAYEAFRSKSLDSDLARITSPLKEGKIDVARINVTDPDGKEIAKAQVESFEKPFFKAEEKTVTSTSKPVVLEGQFVSLNKESDRGSFRMQNGKTVRYHFKAEDASLLHADFAYKGPVSVECVASFDSNLEVKSLDITSVTRLQRELPLQ